MDGLGGKKRVREESGKVICTAGTRTRAHAQSNTARASCTRAYTYRSSSWTCSCRIFGGNILENQKANKKRASKTTWFHYIDVHLAIRHDHTPSPPNQALG